MLCVKKRGSNFRMPRNYCTWFDWKDQSDTKIKQQCVNVLWGEFCVCGWWSKSLNCWPCVCSVYFSVLLNILLRTLNKLLLGQLYSVASVLYAAVFWMSLPFLMYKWVALRSANLLEHTIWLNMLSNSYTIINN